MQGHVTSFFLEGVWKGTGKVADSLEYQEELEFTRVQPNTFFYRQKTRNEEKGPLHSEVGFIRIFLEPNAAEGKLELSASHPFGVCEISEGSFTKDSAQFKTASIIRTTTAIEPYVTKLTRVFKLKDNDTLSYTVDMGTSKTNEECPHLEGELKRVK